MAYKKANANIFYNRAIAVNCMFEIYSTEVYSTSLFVLKFVLLAIIYILLAKQVLAIKTAKKK